MNALKFSLLPYTTTTIVITLFLLLSPVVCFNPKQRSDTRGLLFEEKKRLGSTPPSCHNKCNQCRPCMTVEIPSISSLNYQLEPGPNQLNHNHEYFDSSTLPLTTATYKYSNYKPLGWKCRCGDHFFNP